MTHILDAEARITARDLTGGAFEGVANKINRVNRAAQALSRDLDRHMAVAGRAGRIDRLAARIDSLGLVMDRVGAAARRFGRSMTYGVSLPVGIATGIAGRSVYEFAQVMNTVKAVTNLTNEQKAELEGLIKQLNAELPYTNAEIAKAALELGRAGLNFEQIKGSLRDTLTLGLAGNIELGQSADIATNILTAMRLPMQSAEEAAKSLKRVVDSLAYGANRSNATVAQFGETFKFVGPMAAAAGQDIETMTAAAMNLANAGIKGPEAGVGLRSLLVRMVKPTKEMMATLGRLGINIGDYVKPGRSVSGDDIASTLRSGGIDLPPATIAQIQKTLSNPAAQRSPALMTARITDLVAGSLGDGSAIGRDKIAEAVTDALTIGGSKVDFVGFIAALKKAGADLGDVARIIDARQVARVLGLINSMIDLHDRVEEVRANAPGTGERMANTSMEDIVGPVKRFQASLENLYISLGRSGVIDSAAKLFDGMASTFERLGKTNPKILELSVYAVAATAAIGPLALVIGNLARAAGWLVPSAARAAGAGAMVKGAGAVAAGAIVLDTINRDAKNGNGLRSSLRGALGIDDPNEPAPWLPGGAWNKTDRDMAPEKFEKLMIEDIHRAMRGERKTEIEGRVQTDVRVTVDTTPELSSIVKSATSSRWNGNIHGEASTGSTGPTGTSMPEAMPGVP